MNALIGLYSKLDTDRFGIRIGRANIDNKEALPAVFDAVESESIQMLVARCRTDDFETLHELEKRGALVMDTLVYYQKNLRRAPLPVEIKENIVRPIKDSDLPGLAEVVRDTFHNYTGHYHADSRLDRFKADEGYVDWAMKMCESRDAASREVLIAEHPPGVPAGFATLRMNDANEGEGVLFGVHPSAEGRGIYWSFMVHGMDWCRDRGASRMVVSTQITNIAVQKVWGRLGFEMIKSYYTLHLWHD